MKILLSLIAFSVLLMPVTAKASEDYSEFLNTRCDAIQDKSTQSKFADLNTKDFIDDYLDGFAKKHPQYSMTNEADPFLFILLLACVEEDYKDETIGLSLEKAMIAYFENRKE